MRRIVCSIAGCFLALSLLACHPQSGIAQTSASPAAVDTTAEPVATQMPTLSPTAEAAGTFSVSSAGIVNDVIGDLYGARGTQKTKGTPSLSFPLTFENIPTGTVCLALSIIDPDGGNWVHWLAVNLPVADLAENASIDLAPEIVQGKNDFGFVGYGGPTPPSGTHTYVITVYALSETLPLKDDFSLKQFEESLSGKTIASASLTGDYAH